MLDLIEIDYPEFAGYSSQQFATVVFEREEDDKHCVMTILKDNKLTCKIGDNKYNPSSRRRATCIYAIEEWEDPGMIKICVVQHKGNTYIEICVVDDEEYKYLFGDEPAREGYSKPAGGI